MRGFKLFSPPGR